MYAQRRAPNVGDQRVWMVQIERTTLGTVLDLTKDSRWDRFMNAPLGKGLQNRLYYLKIKHELYDQFFREFLTANKINMRTYDAVVGPEYNLGGNQLCILHKNGLTSKLSLRVRALFRPITSVVRGATMSGGKLVVNVRLIGAGSAKIRFLKGVGGFVASVGIGILISYIFGKLIQNQYEKILQKQLEAMDPDIQASIYTQRRKVFMILANGHKPYVIVHIRVEYFMSMDPDTGWDQSAPGAKLLWIDIKDYKEEKHPPETVYYSMGQRLHTTTHTVASEVTIPQEDVKRYSEAMEELEWYDTALRDHHLIDSDVERLTSEKKTLEETVRQAYGDPPPEIEMNFEEMYPPEKPGLQRLPDGM